VWHCWIGTSWKMNKTLAEGLEFAKTLRPFFPALTRAFNPSSFHLSRAYGR
jgi:L-erythrulose 1-phosphate isomerase